MTTALLIGTLAVAVAALVALLLQHAPTHATCPSCGEATQTVQGHPLLRRAEKVVRRRWCPSCGWEGRGRTGPEWIPGKPVAHDSGFHWGAERFPEDFGFRWASPPEPDPGAEPPDHWSGFRFSPADPATDSPAHPSGFSWGADPEGEVENSEERASATRAHPSGFRWGGREQPDGTFTWAEPPRPKDPPSGFRWKDRGD